MIRCINGMKRARHTSMAGGRAAFARTDPELIERVQKIKRRLFNADLLPEHQLYLESNDEIQNL